MTAPAALTEAQEAELKVHVGSTAWAAWTQLPEDQRVDLGAALRVYAGDLRAVGAHLLRDLAERTAAPQPGVKRVKIGPIELELRPDDGVDVRATWLARAALLAQASAAVASSAMFIPTMDEWGIQ